MHIATVSAEGRGETDRLLSGVAAQLRDEGRALAGIVKVLEHESAYGNGCDVMVNILPAGPVIAITQSLGKGSDACRLDPGAIAEAVARVENGPLAEADLLILNKFGPEEAAGRGFRPVIGKALELGVPVLVGVGGASRDAFDAFAGGLAETLAGEPGAIRSWCDAAIAQKRQAETA